MAVVAFASRLTTAATEAATLTRRVRICIATDRTRLSCA